MKLILLLALLLLAGCSDIVKQSQKESVGLPAGVRTFYDKNTGFRCYTLFDRAISCEKVDE